MNTIPYPERKAIYEDAIATWGAQLQTVVAVEEMSELTKEICKLFRGRADTDAIADEIADVTIMLEQLRLMYGLNDKVCEHMDAKVRRLAARLDAVAYANSHPESIIRAPCLTEVEMERCRVYGAKYVTRNERSKYVMLWDAKPSVIIGEDEGKCYTNGDGESNARHMSSICIVPMRTTGCRGRYPPIPKRTSAFGAPSARARGGRPEKSEYRKFNLKPCITSEKGCKNIVEILQSAPGCGTLSVRNGWIACPNCRRNKRLLRIDPETEAHNLPVYCRDCKREIILDIERGLSARRRSP